MNYDELESEDCTKEEIEELKGTIDIRHLPIDLMEEKYELLTFPEDFYLYNIDDEQSNRYREFCVKYFPYYDDGRYYDLYECGNRVIELILNNELMNNKEKFSLLKKYEIFLEDVLKSSKEDLKHALNEMHKIENEIFEIYSLDMITLMFDKKHAPHSDNVLKLVNRCLLDNDEFLYYQDKRNLYHLNVTQINSVKTMLFNVLIDLQFPNPNKQLKRPRENKFSLANTVFIFDLFRDFELIPNSTSNKTIAESISLLTGFSEKQAINQFAENTDQEISQKLKKDTIELLESMIERLK